MNLKDRMSSYMVKTEPTTKTSEDTMLRSRQQQQESILQMQLETIQRQSEEIQMLSSENSTLKKELQEKSETIVSLNDRIGTLNGADLVLQENRLLRKNNDELRLREQKATEEARATVSACEKKYRKKSADLQARIDAVKEQKQTYQRLTEEESERIDKLASEKADEAYRIKANSLHALTVSGVLYSILATILTAINSQRCLTDLSGVVHVIGSFFVALKNVAAAITDIIWTLTKFIPIDVIKYLIAGILVIVIYTIIFGGALSIVFFLLLLLISIYYTYCADLISVLVTLSSMALLVWLADNLSFISINLVVVFIIINAIYAGIRVLSHRRDPES